GGCSERPPVGVLQGTDDLSPATLVDGPLFENTVLLESLQQSIDVLIRQLVTCRGRLVQLARRLGMRRYKLVEPAAGGLRLKAPNVGTTARPALAPRRPTQSPPSRSPSP